MTIINPGPAPTAAGDGFGKADYAAFQWKVQAIAGIRLGDYKQEQMRRRIGTMAQRAGCPSFLAYFTTLAQTRRR